MLGGAQRSVLTTSTEVSNRQIPEADHRSARIPTGVPDFDYLTGGIPAGSLVLLLGEAGAGHQEFALTSAVHLMMHYDDPRRHQVYLGNARGPFRYPREVVYVSISRSQEQILREVRGSFGGTYPEVLLRHLRFHDLSPAYFAESVVPPPWASLRGPILQSTETTVDRSNDPLHAIADALESDGPSNLVLIDSLTDLLVRRGIDPEELLTLLKGLRRRAKQWEGIVYVLLSRGVAPSSTEQAVMDSVDGVLSFSWLTSLHHSFRQRIMLIEKSMPILAHVPLERQGRFVIQISAKSGLVTTQYERI